MLLLFASSYFQDDDDDDDVRTMNLLEDASMPDELDYDEGILCYGLKGIKTFIRHHIKVFNSNLMDYGIYSSSQKLINFIQHTIFLVIELPTRTTKVSIE